MSEFKISTYKISALHAGCVEPSNKIQISFKPFSSCEECNSFFFFRWSGISGLRTTSSFLSQFSPFYGSTEKCFYLVTLFFLKLAVVDWHWEVEGVVIRFSHSSTSISVTLDLFWFHEWRVLTKGCG